MICPHRTRLPPALKVADSATQLCSISTRLMMLMPGRNVPVLAFPSHVRPSLIRPVDDAPPTAPARPAAVRRRGRASRIAVGRGDRRLLILAGPALSEPAAATRQVLIGWLEQQGIDADVRSSGSSWTDLVARVRHRRPGRPRLSPSNGSRSTTPSTLPWSTGGLGLTPDRIRLVRPVIRARWQDGKLSLGSLDPLIADVMSRPPVTNVRAPHPDRGRPDPTRPPTTDRSRCGPTPASTTAS